eukprot:NODE_5924_length_1721_cov_5.896487.p1 GENE.NODE_5924_length_1721_cov_5.896487~~NODE_5924_length_1721_cov_5.896487.p1  ORF type:complete len:213 (+),score=31.10 NODE_5924_length_1721_cov_5.896487:469-1107(+)
MSRAIPWRDTVVQTDHGDLSPRRRHEHLDDESPLARCRQECRDIRYRSAAPTSLTEVRTGRRGIPDVAASSVFDAEESLSRLLQDSLDLKAQFASEVRQPPSYEQSSVASDMLKLQLDERTAELGNMQRRAILDAEHVKAESMLRRAAEAKAHSACLRAERAEAELAALLAAAETRGAEPGRDVEAPQPPGKLHRQRRCQGARRRDRCWRAC